MADTNLNKPNEDSSIFSCLDIDRNAVTRYQTGVDTIGVIVIGLITLALLLFCIFTLDIQKALFRTENAVILTIINMVFFTLVEQKVIRVFGLHESKLLDIYIQQKLSSNVNLAPYYDIRPDGFELCRHSKIGLFDKCLYNSGKESIFINFYLGSKYGRGENTRELNVQTYTTALNYLNSKGYRVVKNSYREPNVNEDMFRYYDTQILEEDTEFAQDFAKIINHFKSKQPMLYMYTVQVLATTPRQKIELINDVVHFITIMSSATFRKIKVLRQNDILAYLKIENGLNILDLSHIILDTDKSVSLGVTRVLSIHDENLNVLNTISKSSKPALQGDDVIAFKRYRFKSKKKVAKEKAKEDNDNNNKLILG